MPALRRAPPTSKAAASTPHRPFDLEGFFPFEIVAAASRVTAAFNARCLAPEGLTPGEWRVVATVGRHDGISATEVSRIALLDKVKVSRAVAGLAGRGVLRQARNAEDKRARRLHLTRRGRTLLDRLTGEARAFETALARGFAAADLAALRVALAKVAPE